MAVKLPEGVERLRQDCSGGLQLHPAFCEGATQSAEGHDRRFVLLNSDGRSGPGVGTVRHVLLLSRLGVAGQQDADRAVAQEDGHRVVVCL